MCTILSRAILVNILDFQILNSTNSQNTNLEIYSELITNNWVKTHSINKNNSQLKTKTDHKYTVEKPPSTAHVISSILIFVQPAFHNNSICIHKGDFSRSQL